MKRIFSLLILFLSLLGVQAAEIQKSLADSMYAAGKYEQAITLYQKILQQGDNATIYYNLGNAYYRLHDMGHAILNYERAANREPGDADIRVNLALARSKTVDKIESNDGFFLVYWFRSFLNSMNTDQWGRLSIGAFVFMLSGVLVYVFGRRLLFRKIGFFAAVVMFFLTFVFNIFAYLQRKQYLDNTHAVVMETSRIKSSPAASGTVLFSLHEGTKVKILDNSMRDWVEIKISDGKTGWMQKTDMEII